MSLLHRQLAALMLGLLLATAAHAQGAFMVEGDSGFTSGDWGASRAAPARSCGPSCGPSCSSCESGCAAPCDYPQYCCDGPCPHRWLAGVEFTVLKPVATNSVGFTQETTVLDTTTISESDLDYNMVFAPRVWVEVLSAGDFGLRGTYWVADQTATSLRSVVPADTLILSPEIGGGSLIAVEDDTFEAEASFTAYTIDLEGVKHVPGSMWKLCFSGGVRYARVEQNYHAQRRDDVNALVGVVDFDHSIQGVGPTFAIVAGQPLGCRVALFGQARASVLFGETQTQLDAGDATLPAFTSSTATRHELFSITELQVGLQWSPEYEHPWKPLVRVAFEGQLWDGPGSPTQESGLFGLYGLNITLGMAW